MAVQDMVKAITERLGESADVEKVFGEPKTIGRKTIIPVATIRMGMGGGLGHGKHHGDGEDRPEEGEGGGAGGGEVTRPLAVLEVTDEQTKLIPVIDLTRVILSGIVFAGMATWMITKTIARLKK